MGGMALGGSLLVLAAQQLLDGTRPVRRAVVTALLVAGGLLWIVGVYQKEVSLAAIPLLAAVAVAGRGRLRSWHGLARARRRLLVAVGLVLVVPLAHVAFESARITLGGDLVYDAKVERGRGLAQGVQGLYDWAHAALPEHWELVVVGALVLTVGAAVVRRTVDLVAIGVLGSAGLALVLAGQSGVVATRYLIPVLALLAVALSLALARFTPVVQLVGAACSARHAGAGAAGAPECRRLGRRRDRSRQPRARDRGRPSLRLRRCGGRARGGGGAALPVLVDLRARAATGTCADGGALLVAGTARRRRRAPPRLRPRQARRRSSTGSTATLYRCGRLRESASARTLVEQRRL